MSSGVPQVCSEELRYVQVCSGVPLSHPGVHCPTQVCPYPIQVCPAPPRCAPGAPQNPHQPILGSGECPGECPGEPSPCRGHTWLQVNPGAPSVPPPRSATSQLRCGRAGAPHLRLRCCSLGSTPVQGSLTWGSGAAEFEVHTWPGSPHLGLRCSSPGAAEFGVHTCPGVPHLRLRCCRVWGPHLARISSPAAQVSLRCSSPGAAVWGPHLAEVPSPAAQVSLSRCCRFQGPHLSRGPSPVAQVLQFWGPHLSRCAVAGFPHLRLRCRSPGVTAAPFWGPNHIFGVHTCPGSHIWGSHTGGSGDAVQVLLLHLFGVHRRFLGSTPVLAHRSGVFSPGAQAHSYRVLSPGASSTGLR
ncbi:uncharacterized protein LOC119696690 [Motacilla alba alba]|uniref:uncharacterized protein LOC119696690 n=1 Tax=Motacilla alba alba TaxID=1094192 RepID=UPI0018D5621C|nr:uncharacterized protein LOC119696690 [Motacilla alba alba]